ncbi:MAG: hypothetical protein LBL56_08350 [Treponema sp.]|jgi:hypothetical protein|nr:hypothetical protein [Treponema sp.]
MKIKKESFGSPPALFIYYMLASSLTILIIYLFFPSQGAPLPIFSRDWRFTLGLLEILSLFPALAFSALVVPFGFRIYYDDYRSFSPHFLEQFKGPLVIAILAAIVYALLFFLVQPTLQDKRISMTYQGSLYRLARDQARDRALRGRWDEAAGFLRIAGQVWPNSPELAQLRIDTEIEVEGGRIREQDELQMLLERSQAGETWSIQDTSVPAFPNRSALPGQRQPLNTPEALEMAAAAMGEERYYDAHWLATLGLRLAPQGSPEEAAASRAAGLAWDAVSSLAPNTRERELYAIYRLKQSGYEAMVAGDWIRAYYIFRELAKQSPTDPEVGIFLQKSEEGTGSIAFFTDEMGQGMGSILTNAVFSLPYQPRSGGAGRGIIRFSSISLYEDYAYAFGLEFICFDSANRPESAFEAPYAKIVPMTLGGRDRVVVLMQALDRSDQDQHWEPVWNSLEESATVRRPTLANNAGNVGNASNAGNVNNIGSAGAAGGFLRSSIGDNQIMLDLSFESFILLCNTWRGLGVPIGSTRVSPLDGFSLGDLFAAAQSLSPYGYVPQVFEAEIIYRLCEPLFFLPAAVIIIIMGWRFRALSRARFVFVPMLFILPLVFNGLVYFYRQVFNILGIFSLLNLGFSATLIIYALAAGILFVLSLIVFAAQHS